MKKHAAVLLYFATFLLCLFAFTLPSCGATVDCKDPANSKNIKCVPAEVENALIDCSKALVTPQALVDVAQAFTGSDWAKGMENLGVKYGISVASCAARDVVAIWTASSAPVASGSASGSGAGAGAAAPPITSQPKPEVLHAKAYLADKKFKE